MSKVLKLFESVLNLSIFNKYVGIEKNRISRHIMIHTFYWYQMWETRIEWKHYIDVFKIIK